jgi:hypothetical protein
MAWISVPAGFDGVEPDRRSIGALLPPSAATSAAEPGVTALHALRKHLLPELSELCLEYLDEPWRAYYYRRWRQYRAPAHFAARNGLLDMLAWALDSHRDAVTRMSPGSICYLAARGGHLAALQLARDRKVEWGAMTLHEAARHGRLALMQWARANGCPWSASTTAAAASRGHLDVLRWLRENGCPWDFSAYIGATMCGHHDVLRWLCDAGCPKWKRVCQTAAGIGRLDILQWARCAGFLWDSLKVMRAAAENGHLAILQWGAENNLLDHYSMELADAILATKNPEILSWYREVGN